MEEASDEENSRLKKKYREKKNAANKAVAKVRDEKQQEWSKRIEEDGVKFAKQRNFSNISNEEMGYWSLE